MSDFIEQDEVEVPEAAPDIPPMSFWSSVNDNLDVQVGDAEAEEEGPSRAELAEQLKAERERIAALERDADAVKGMQAAVEGLGEKLGAQRTQYAAPAVPPRYANEQEYRKAIQEMAYDEEKGGLASAIEEVQQVKLGNMFQQSLQNTLYFSKRDIERDPERTETYKRYRAEIDEEMKLVPDELKYRNPDIYAQTHDKVLLRHKDEVISETVNKMVEERLKELGLGAGAAPAAGVRKPVHFSESGITPPAKPKSGTEKVRITQTEADWAFKQGMNTRDYAAWAKRNPNQADIVKKGRR